MRGMYTFLRLFCISVLALAANHAGATGHEDETCPDAAFNIRGVEVSASARSGSEARRLATKQGLDRAWRLLTERLLLDGERINEAAPKAEDGADAAAGVAVDDLVDHVRVLNERVLSERYIAAFDYCFDRGGVRRHFAAMGVRHAEQVSAPMLVLPIWNSGGKPRIWRQPNLWINAWEEALGNYNGLVTLRLPQSLAAERSISPQAALEKQRDTLARAARLEGAEKVIVTVVTPVADGDSISATVSASLHNRDGSLESEFYNIDPLKFPINSTSEAMLWLVGQIGNGIEKVWRSVNAVTLVEAENVVALRISADNIAEWQGLVGRLRSLPPVERVRVMQLAPGGGVVRVELSSSMQSFVYALEAEGLAIDRKVGGDGAVALDLVPREG